MFSSNLAACLAAKIYCSKLAEFPQPSSEQPSGQAIQVSLQKAQSLEYQPKNTAKTSAQRPAPVSSDCSHIDSIPPQSDAPTDSAESLITPPESSSRTSAEFLLAAPENLNPGLAPPPPPPPPLEVPPVNPSESPAKESNTSQPLSIILKSAHLNFRYNSSNFGQLNRIIEPTLDFSINDEFSIAVTTGFNFFDQPNGQSVTNVPLQFNWQDEIGDLKVTAGGGVDLFDRLPPQPNFNANVVIPVFSTATLNPIIEYGAYKFNAKTLENQINALRFGTNFYWQIEPHTSLFSSFRLGTYSDGNFEQQSFSRLEHRIGNFSVALNLFNWAYSQNLEQQSGYFSPGDFLVYNGEIAWQDDIFEFLNCRVAASIGNGRLEGNWSLSYTVQGLCAVKLSPNVSLDLGYNFSNVKDNLTGGSAYNNQAITGGVNINF